MTYEVGETVEYKPPGGPVGVFTIIRRMPHDPSGERIYRIKSDLEFCERNVLEICAYQTGAIPGGTASDVE